MKKIFLSLLLCLSIGTSIIIPLQTHAAFPVSVLTDWQFYLKEFGLDGLARLMARIISQQFTNATVEWLRSGGKGGGPLFVTDFNAFIKDAGNEASGAFLERIGAADILCGPFPLTFDVTIWGGVDTNPYDRFDCTIEDVVANMEDWEREFDSGGWDAWNELLKPQNRAGSAFLLAINTAAELGGDAKDETKIRAGAAMGLLGQQKCEEVTVPLKDGKQVTETRCKTTTPGDAIHSSLSDSFGKNADWLFSVDEINELVVAFADFAVTKLFSGDDGILGGGASEDISGSDRSVRNMMDALRRYMERLANLLERTANIVENYINETIQSRPVSIKKNTPECSGPFVSPSSNPECYYTTDDGGCDPAITGGAILRACPVYFEYNGEMVNARQLLFTLRGLETSVRSDITNRIPNIRTLDDLRAYGSELSALWNTSITNIRIAEGVMREGQIEETENRIEEIEDAIRQYMMQVN